MELKSTVIFHCSVFSKSMIGVCHLKLNEGAFVGVKFWGHKKSGYFSEKNVPKFGQILKFAFNSYNVIFISQT